MKRMKRLNKETIKQRKIKVCVKNLIVILEDVLGLRINKDQK